MLQIFFIIVFATVGLLTNVRAAGASYLDLSEAAHRGMVDIVSSTNSDADIIHAISQISTLRPGIINRLTYNWGGPSSSFLLRVAAYVKSVRLIVPDVLIVGTLPEAVGRNYKSELPCDDAITFNVKTEIISSHQEISAGNEFIDLSMDGAVVFYECLAKFFISSGITIISFESASDVIRHSRNPARATTNYQLLQARILKFALDKNKSVYFAGGSILADKINVDLYVSPSRLYHTSSKYERYRNKVKTSKGVGYSYVISPNLIMDVVSQFKKGTYVFFGIDNWDGSQDDLRRMMELDAENRRYLFTESSKAARSLGVRFSLPIIHCKGCTPEIVPVDQCEILRGAAMTIYRAQECADIPTLKEALDIQRASRQ